MVVTFPFKKKHTHTTCSRTKVAIGRYVSKQAPRKPEEDLEEDPMPLPMEDLSRLLGETQIVDVIFIYALMLTDPFCKWFWVVG